ncbi:MAG: hypothetical protein QUT30_00380, partial [Acidobacteriota bacterium]|nr:hypothetical protein [Acidobacteriota bacterium]
FRRAAKSSFTGLKGRQKDSSGLASLLPATGGSPRCLRQLGSPPAIFLLPLRGYIAPRLLGVVDYW